MIAVAVHQAHGRRRVSAAGVRRVIQGVLRGERRRSGAISVVLTDDRLSRRINRKFLSHDRPTDVIAFPLERRPALEGELYINLDKAIRQARTYRVSPANEVARLVIHGTLHLLGYDDLRPAAARRMKARENRYVQSLATKDTNPR